MRIFLSIIVSFLFFALNAQIVNPEFPKGVYKMAELTSEAEMKFVFDSNNKMCIFMNVMDKQIFIKGNYTSENDTVALTFLPIYMEGVYNNSLSGKIQVQFEDSYGFGRGTECNVYKNSDTTAIASDKFLSSIEWNHTDTMRIHVYDGMENKADLYYIIPDDVNELIVTKNMDLYSLREELYLAKGDSGNELLLLDKKKNSSDGSIFYLGEINEKTFPITDKKKEIEPIKKDYDIKEYKSSYYGYENAETKIYTDYTEALKVAKDEYKLLRIYNGSDVDTTSIKESFMYVGFPANDVFVCLVNENNSISHDLVIKSPQEDILYTDSLSSYSSWGIKERIGPKDNIEKYIEDYSRLLDERILTNDSNKPEFIRQYLVNSINLRGMSSGVDQDTLNTKKYLAEYINTYNKYSPDSLILNSCIQLAVNDVYRSSSDSTKWTKLPEYLKYLLVNRDMKEISKSFEENRHWGKDMPLRMFFMSLAYKRELPFSIIKELENTVPQYSDYLYSLYLSSGVTDVPIEDMTYMRRYFAPIIKKIKPTAKSSNVEVHSAMEVINDRAKKMFESDPVRLLYPFGENFEDIYEISSFYIDMYSTMLNNLAWRGYRNKDLKNLDEYLKYSEISLDLDPDNHYSYDTYAHLLYTKGDKAKAIKMEERALELASLTGEKNSIEIRLYKLKLKAMQLGTLEEYNTLEWNMEQD